MTTLVKRLLPLVIPLIIVPITASQRKADVSGQWDFTIDSPQGTSTPLVTLKVEGDKVTGTLKGRRGELPLTGTVKGSEIKLAYTVNFQGNDLNISLSGTTETDSMKGTADFGGLATGSWAAKRHQEDKSAPASSAPAASGDRVDISGSWIFTVETDQGSGSPSFTFKQEGERLTGTYKGLFGEAALEGTIKGRQINFSFKVNAQGVEGTVTYSGVIEKDSMKGTVKLGDLGSGTWTARRQ